MSLIMMNLHGVTMILCISSCFPLLFVFPVMLKEDESNKNSVFTSLPAPSDGCKENKTLVGCVLQLFFLIVCVASGSL